MWPAEGLSRHLRLSGPEKPVIGPPATSAQPAGFYLTGHRNFLIEISSTNFPRGNMKMAISAKWSFNGESKVILGNWHRVWCLIFGPLYYLFKGMWLWALLSLLTANGLWLGFPLYNRSIVLRHFHRKGWVQE